MKTLSMQYDLLDCRERGQLPQGVELLDMRRFDDERGFFAELFNASRYADDCSGSLPDFVQDNVSLSVKKGVLRGLHFQHAPCGQAKFISILQGSVYDVIVDLRASSQTRGQAFGVELSDKNKRQLFVPVGFAHGFMTLEENTLVHYKTSSPYSATHDAGILYNDSQLGIQWPLNEALTLSDKDIALPKYDAKTHYFD